MSIEEKINSKCQNIIHNDTNLENSEKKEEEQKNEPNKNIQTDIKIPEKHNYLPTDIQNIDNHIQDKNQIPQIIKNPSQQNQLISQNKTEPLNKKKDWSTWSTQEKIHFYEIIANGGNFTSLQKLFKTMNYVISFFYNFYSNLLRK